MASEIKVDTIVNAGGDNDTGIDLATNDQILLKVANATKLTMNSTGQTTIVGEGGTTTTNLQQGLTKHWALVSGDGFSVADSFNSSGITDNGTGDGTFAFTNPFANGNFSTTALSTEDGSRGYITMYYDRSYSANANNVRLQGIDEGDSFDDGSLCSTMSTGDLA